MRSGFLPLLLVLSATGCTAWHFTEPKTPPVEPFSPPPKGLAEVCVLRPHLLASAVTFSVKDNGMLVGATRGASYFCYWAQPGNHHIQSEGDDVEEANLFAVEGTRYYLHQDVHNMLGYVTSPLEWVSETEARGMVSRCDYRVLEDVPSGMTRPPANPIALAGP
ncbi:MAG: hypothetical protein ACXVEF_18585 [Polyangiales bacterium]